MDAVTAPYSISLMELLMVGSFLSALKNSGLKISGRASFSFFPRNNWVRSSDSAM